MRPLILSLIITVLCTAIKGESCKLNQPVCPQVEGTEYELTVLPLITDCSKYILCQRGRPIIRPCPGDLVFNAELRVCDFPNRTECIQCDEQQPEITATSPELTTSPEITSTSTKTTATSPEITTGNYTAETVTAEGLAV